MKARALPKRLESKPVGIWIRVSTEIITRSAPMGPT